MNRIRYLVILLLGITCAVIFWLFIKESRALEASEREVSRLRYYGDRLESNLFYFGLYNSSRLTAIEVTNLLGEKSLLDSQVDSRKLVFRFGRLHCNLCYEKELQRLAVNVDENDRSKVVVLVSFSRKEFKALGKRFEEVVPGVIVLNYEGVLPIHQEEFNEPYYFVLENDGAVHSVFFPDKVIEGHSLQYLSSHGF